MVKTIKQWWSVIVAFFVNMTGGNPDGGTDTMSKMVSNSGSGEIILGCGLHEIVVKTEGGKPARVTLCIKDPCDAVPCCLGDVNRIGVTLTCDGFVLYADIRTNTCCVEWECDFTC